MINRQQFTVLESEGFCNKSDAYEHIQIWYSHLKGVTTYFDNGLWYIVQSNVLR